MEVETTRFGKIQVEEAAVIRFEAGLIGFRNHREFVLVPHGSSSVIAWLQSLVAPDLAFPVLSAHGIVAEYPDVPLGPVAERAGIRGDAEDLAVLAVLSAPPGQPPTVNLLAPLLVDSRTRAGAQVFLEGSRFTTQEILALPLDPKAARAPAAATAP